ncbi:sulfatase [Stieleria varia]|uniref:Arylsulfatase n=1 Tax=Stieleria varia TaxID=2528005 RepID=A0A5C6B1J6_9BACT|nr:sulfatase [Stieleria varia]TWU06185.1 Arylsulfatase [Stieleria varia]
MALKSIALATLLLTLWYSNVASASDRPNILLINIDDMGWRDVGFMGTDFYETPHLDAIASDSLVFTNAYAGAANCAPSRACLLSGQTTPRHRIFNVGTHPRGKEKNRLCEHIPGVDVLDTKIVTWAKLIQDAGYRTGTIGKWHLSQDPRPYGFDVNVAGTQSGSPPRGHYPPHPGVGLDDAAEDEYLTDRLTDEAIKFIRESACEPWLLYLPHFAVHTPLDAKRELLAKYKAKSPGKLHDHVAMATMIQSVDDGIGRLLTTLGELKMRENTLIVFTSDNGGYGPATDMDPLKGYKGTYYEGGIRVPFFVHWSGKIKSGRSDEPIAQIDLYPTFCALLGISPPEGQPLDGVNLLPLWTGQVPALPKRSLFWHFPAYLESYRNCVDEQRDPLFRSRPVGVIRQGDWKLMEFFESGDLELYHLTDDIGETSDLSASHPEKRDELHAELKAWRAAVDAPVPRRK